MSENQYLSGNFAPVEGELTSFDLQVEGRIPEGLNGRFLRIGPNPIGPDPASYHWFTGSGMVHGLQLRDGKAEWYRRRFVRDDAVVEAFGGPPIVGPASPANVGGNTANTHVLRHAGKIYALVEAGGRPIELSDELETVALSDFGGTLPAGFTAHPKIDPETGEMHAAIYSPLSEDIWYTVVGADGLVKRIVEIPLPHKPMIHDCAITPNWFIVIDTSVHFDASVLEEGGSFPFKWHPEQPSRIGLLPRNGEASDIVWCETDSCYVFHPMNAYEDDQGRVVIDVIRHDKMFSDDPLGPFDGRPALERWLVDPTGGPIKRELLDDRAQEFPRIDDRRCGRRHHYGYTAMFWSGSADKSGNGLIKHDLTKGGQIVHQEGSDRHFLEPVFVPACEDAAEDEGWVLAYVYDAERNGTDVVILAAQDFAAEPVATIRLPERVPFGFHGSWDADA